MGTITIGDSCEVLNGYAFKSEKYTSSGIRVIRIANVQKGYIEDDSPVFYQTADVDLNKYMLRENDLLVSLTGNVGRTALLTKDMLPAVLNQRVACLRLKTNKITRGFLFHLLNSDYFESKCIQSSQGVAQKNLSTEWLKSYDLPLYSLSKQNEITKILDNLRNTIILKEQEINKFDELIKARFVEMFGDYLKYDRRPLSEVAIITGGLTKNSNRNTFETKMPYLRVANVFYNRLDLREILKIGVKEEEIEKTLLQAGDLLFVEGNGSIEQIGRVAIWDGSIDPILHQNHLIKARFNNEIIAPEYALFYFMLQDGRQQIISKSVSTSGLNTLSVNKVSSLLLPIPPIALQKQFSVFVKLVDKSRFDIKKSITELEREVVYD